jgi:hypothetical protein
MTSPNHALELAIRKYARKLKYLEKTRCPTFLGSLPLTMVEIVLGTGQFFYRLWMSIINIPIVGAPLHLADDVIQIVQFELLRPFFVSVSVRVGSRLSNISFQTAWLQLIRLIPSKVNSIFQHILSSKIFRPFYKMARYVKYTRYRQHRWQRKVIDLLISRDELEGLLGDEDSGCDHGHLSSGVLKRVIKLDDRLREQSDRIFRTRNLERLQEFRKPKPIHWWWNLNPPRYRLDWLWQTIIYSSIIGATSFGADVASRFFAGGDFLGVVAVVGPALLAILIGKESFSQISAGLEDALKKLGIPKRYWRESILIFIMILFIISGMAYSKKPEAAICYYYAGRDIAFSLDQIIILDGDIPEKQKAKNINCSLPLPLKLPSSHSGIVKAESHLKIANAFDSDNPGISFALGYLYELQQDFDSTKKYYRASMQNGSKLARLRLAKLYLQDNKEESAAIAANILLQQPPGTEMDLANKLAWRTALASVRIRQKRYSDAQEQVKNASKDIMNSGLSQNDKAIEKIHLVQLEDGMNMASFLKKLSSESDNRFDLKIPDQYRVVGIIDCIRFDILSHDAKILKDKAEISKAEEKNRQSKVLENNCYNSTSASDIFQDTLRGKLRKVLDSEEIINDQANSPQAK